MRPARVGLREVTILPNGCSAQSAWSSGAAPRGLQFVE